jgi:hypothetical protein
MDGRSNKADAVADGSSTFGVTSGARNGWKRRNENVEGFRLTFVGGFLNFGKF